MKTLKQLLVELSRGGPREGCYIKNEDDTDPHFVSLNNFIDMYPKNFGKFIVKEVRENSLLMQWEIIVKENKDERK